MRYVSLLAGALAAGALTLSWSNDAQALGPIDLEVGAKAGYGTNPFGGNLNPLGAGIGGRAGVGFFGFYGGVAGMYYFGGSQDGVSVHSAQYGFEAGYNIKIALLTLRPQLGIGNFGITGTVANLSSTSNSLYLEPGLTALVSLGLVYLGADANALILPNVQQPDTTNKGTNTAFTLHGQVGVRF